ncbi:hypothetical protein M8J77_002528 [Diaphorina citri]|nr:hypothetical protein M8J77_002528 [Diaphorina citri]
MQNSEVGSHLSTRHSGGGNGGGGTPQQFCLRWNNYQSNLTNVFDQLLQSESFVDVTLACDGNSLKAHKMVLSACSPYFQNVLSENPCQHPIIILKDIRWFELKAVVEFMYKGEINVCQEDIAPLLQVAESLKVRGLADVNNEHDLTTAKPNPSDKSSEDTSIIPSPSRPNTQGPSAKKRRRLSIERCSPEDTRGSPSRALELVTSPPTSQPHHFHPPLPPPSTPTPQPGSQGQGNNNMLPLPLPPPLPAASSIADDLEIKPGIAEMIREEERVSYHL